MASWFGFLPTWLSYNDFPILSLLRRRERDRFITMTNDDILTPFPHSRLDVALRLDLDLCFLPPFLRDILILSLPRNLIYIISSNTKLNESLIWVAVNTFDIHYPFQWPLNLRCSQNKFIWKLSFHRFNRPGEVMIDDSILSATFFTRGDNYPP